MIVDLEPMEGTASLRNRFAQPGYLVTLVSERGKLMAMVAGGVMLLVLLFLLLAPRSYTARSVVLIDPRNQQAVAGDPVLSGLEPDDKIIETEVQMIQSRSVAQQVGEDLKLRDDPNFMQASGGLLGSIRSMFGGEQTVEDQNRTMTDKLLRGLDIDRVGTSYAIQIGWSGKDSAEAAKIANQFAQRYVINQIDVKDAATSEVNRKIRDRLTDLRKQLADAEARQLAYRQRTGLVSSMDAGNHAMAVARLNEQAAMARAQAAEQRALLAATNSQRGETAPAAQASPAVQALRSQAATIGAQAAMLNARYGPENPAVIQINEQQRQINAALDQEVARSIRAAREAASAAAAAAAQRAGSSDSSLGSVQGALGSNSAALARLAALDREVIGLTTLYNTYMSRFNETGVNIGLQTADARVVSRAVAPYNASFPNVPLTLALGILLAVFAAIGAAIVAELILLLRMRRQEAVLVG